MIKKIILKLMKKSIEFYQYFISPLFPPVCRFQPSCSRYALDALTIHGPYKGLWLATKRILRCHPFNPGGYDPVPPIKKSKSS